MLSGPLYMNAFIQRDETGIIKEMHTHPEMINQVDSSNWTPFHWASFSGQAHIVTLLIAHNAKSKIFTTAIPLYIWLPVKDMTKLFVYSLKMEHPISRKMVKAKHHRHSLVTSAIRLFLTG